jgi:hypothetical protein
MYLKVETILFDRNIRERGRVHSSFIPKIKWLEGTFVEE